jgi:hypothetical protein
MKKGRGLWLSLLAVVALLGLGVWLLRPHEPRYEGRSLSAWLDDLSGPPWARVRAQAKTVRLPPTRVANFTLSPEEEACRQKAIKALDAMGSNALPCLLEQMKTKDSTVKQTLMNLCSRQSIFPIYFRNARERGAQAVQGICAIGKPAMPILEQFLDEKDLALQAAAGLARIGPEALHPLMRALTNDSKMVRNLAVAGISRMQSEAARIVPAMIERLSDGDAVHRKNAAIILGHFGSEAKPAVRSLLKMLNDEEVNARRAASNALRQIERQMPEQAAFR